jgi:hypothetical protein
MTLKKCYRMRNKNKTIKETRIRRNRTERRISRIRRGSMNLYDP